MGIGDWGLGPRAPSGGEGDGDEHEDGGDLFNII